MGQTHGYRCGGRGKIYEPDIGGGLYSDSESMWLWVFAVAVSLGCLAVFLHMVRRAA